MKKKIVKAILRGLDKPLDKTIKAARRATGTTAKGKGKTLRQKRESLDKQLVKQGKTNRAIKKTVYGGAGAIAAERLTRGKNKSSGERLRKEAEAIDAKFAQLRKKTPTKAAPKKTTPKAAPKKTTPKAAPKKTPSVKFKPRNKSRLMKGAKFGAKYRGREFK